MSAHQLTINEFTVNKIYFLGNIQSTVNLVVMLEKEFMINPLLPQPYKFWNIHLLAWNFPEILGWQNQILHEEGEEYCFPKIPLQYFQASAKRNMHQVGTKVCQDRRGFFVRMNDCPTWGKNMYGYPKIRSTEKKNNAENIIFLILFFLHVQLLGHFLKKFSYAH